MTGRPAPTEEGFRSVLTGEDPGLGGMRNVLRRIPSNPRCKLCAAPFGSAGGAVLRHFGYGRYAGNPSLCNKCIREFQAIGIMGAEIPATLLFADVRGSTAMGERMRPAEFRAYLDRFYRIGTEAIQRHDGIVDKLVGDEVIGLFFGGVSGPDHAADALRAAREILERVGRDDATPMGPIPVGVGVHTGEAYVGTSGSEGVPDDFTALGDVVNTTARLASAAAAGELLVSLAAMNAAGLAPLGNEVRKIEVKGREAALDVVIVRPDAPLAV
jgi:adenylate cyclase